MLGFLYNGIAYVLGYPSPQQQPPTVDETEKFTQEAIEGEDLVLVHKSPIAPQPPHHHPQVETCPEPSQVKSTMRAIFPPNLMSEIQSTVQSRNPSAKKEISKEPEAIKVNGDHILQSRLALFTFHQQSRKKGDTSAQWYWCNGKKVSISQEKTETPVKSPRNKRT